MNVVRAALSLLVLAACSDEASTLAVEENAATAARSKTSVSVAQSSATRVRVPGPYPNTAASVHVDGAVHEHDPRHGAAETCHRPILATLRQRIFAAPM